MLIDTRKLMASGEPAGTVKLSGGDYAWVSGYCFSGNEPQIGRELAEAVRAASGRPDAGAALSALNGSFSAIFVSAAGDRVEFVSDRVGTRPVFYALDRGALLIDEDFWAVCDALPAPKMNVAAAVEMLTFKDVIGEHTLVEQIMEVPCATHMTFQINPQSGAATLASSKRYWYRDLRPEARPRDAMVAELGAIFERMSIRYGALVRKMGAEPIAVNLSGGRDSRTVACLMHAAGVKAHGFTSSWPRRGTESRDATAVSQTLGWPHTFLPYWARLSPVPFEPIFWALAPTTHFTVCNHTMSVGTYGKRDVKFGVLASGHLGDYTTTSHIKFRTYLRRGRGRAFHTDVIVRLHTRWSPTEFRQYLRPEHADAAESGLRHLRELCERAQVTDPMGLAPQVDLEQLERRGILRDYLGQRQLSNAMMPLADHEFMDFFARVPYIWLIGGALYVTTIYERLLVGLRAGLRQVPMNLKLPRPIKHPLLWNALQAAQYAFKVLRLRIRQKIEWRRQVAEKRDIPIPEEYVDDGSGRGWIADLGWLCDTDAVERLVAANLANDIFVQNQVRSLYTLARVSGRVRNRAVRPSV